MMTPEQRDTLLNIKRAALTNALRAKNPEDACLIINRAHNVAWRYLQEHYLQNDLDEPERSFLDNIHHGYYKIRNWFLIQIPKMDDTRYSVTNTNNRLADARSFENETEHWLLSNRTNRVSKPRGPVSEDELRRVLWISNTESPSQSGTAFSDACLNAIFEEMRQTYTGLTPGDEEHVKQRDSEGYLRKVAALIDRHTLVSEVRPAEKVHAEELPDSANKKLPAARYEKAISVLRSLECSVSEARRSIEGGAKLGYTIREFNLKNAGSALSVRIWSLLSSIESRSFTSDDYLSFKKEVKPLLKQYVELNEPCSVFRSIYSALVTCVRAFFRVFDVLFHLGSKQTWNDTPGREPFLKPAEASFSQRMVALEREFNETIDALDEEIGKTLMSGPRSI